MLYEAAGGFHFPKIVRFNSNDGGRTAASQTTILDMLGESQGQSHQVSNITFGPDGKLYVHMGDGFFFVTALDLDSYRGKILRLNPDGSAPADNPFYDPNGGFNARDYVYAYGFRNPFGGAWRLSDGKHYEVENGATIDRFARVDAGASYRYDGSDESMPADALFIWNPVVAPVNIAFVEPGVFGGERLPARSDGPGVYHDVRAHLDPRPLARLQAHRRVRRRPGRGVGHREGAPRPVHRGPVTAPPAASPPAPTVYFTDLYEDSGFGGATVAGAKVLRIRYVGQADFYSDVQRGPAPLPVRFTDTSAVPKPPPGSGASATGSAATSGIPFTCMPPPGIYNVRLAVASAGAPVVTQRNAYIEVTSDLRAAYIGGDPNRRRLGRRRHRGPHRARVQCSVLRRRGSQSPQRRTVGSRGAT